jgi:hypothetical protein
MSWLQKVRTRWAAAAAYQLHNNNQHDSKRQLLFNSRLSSESGPAEDYGGDVGTRRFYHGDEADVTTNLDAADGDLYDGSAAVGVEERDGFVRRGRHEGPLDPPSGVPCGTQNCEGRSMGPNPR